MFRHFILSLVFVSFVGAEYVSYSNVLTETDIATLKHYGSTRGTPTRECHASEVNEEDIHYNIYTRERALFNVKIYNISKEFYPAYHHVEKVTKFIVHGWMQSNKDPEFLKIVDDYLYTQDVNVITMDWSAYAKVCNLESIVNIVPVVAGSLDHLMKLLLARGTNATQFHVVGFGVGAHIAGIAGKEMHPHMIGRITALEPIGFHFDYAGVPKLQTSDAHLVDVIKTTLGHHVSKKDVGHIIFYPEGGHYPQPNCDAEDKFCSVQASINYFRRSIVTPAAYPAKKFADFHEFKEGEVYGEHESSYTPDNYMGEYLEPTKFGKYYVNIKNLPVHTRSLH